MTIWLIGTHLVRNECYNLQEFDLKTIGDYRLWVHRKIYQVADAILKDGGVLHIVDRGEVPSSDLLIQDILNGHRQIAEGMKTSLEIQSNVATKTYTEPTEGRRVSMTPTLGTSGRMADFSKLAMRSVIAVKR